MRIRNISFVSIMTWLTLTSTFTSVAAPQLLDRIVAIINNKPILQSDITEKISTGLLVKISDFPSSPKDSPFDRALNDSINVQLILDEAKRFDIEVEDDQVEKQIQEMMKDNGQTKPWLIDFLAQQNKTYEDYKKDIREHMILFKFKGRAIRPLIKITKKDVEHYYLKKQGSTVDAVELSIRQIFISADTKSDSPFTAEKRKMAQEVYQTLQSGVPFLEVEKIYSDRSDARQGVEAHAYRLKDFSPDIRQELEKLQIGEFSRPVETSSGFFLFFLENKKFTGSQDYQSKAKELENELLAVEIEAQLINWIKTARAKAKITYIQE
ncbi:MAG: SurA N-terminal domain-containing protein [Oligoflexales bacterium]|nr:SurA N-terminal domain-containing protein [Oligoflexales bacterium]